MANESQNGSRFIETVDPEDPEYIKELQRPAVVKEDMRQMETRQRVSSMLNSQSFREELESIVTDRLKNTSLNGNNLYTLQQVNDLFSNPRLQLSTASKANSNAGASIIPVNDIRGVDTRCYAKGERLIRCKMASLYRVIGMQGWASGIANFVSARMGQQDLEQYLVNPHGLLFSEVTASSLVKVNLNELTVVEPGSTAYGINRTAFSLHSAIYKARPDIRCIVHVHTNAVTSVSSMKCGLLPISQEAILCGNVSYHDYKGVIQAEEDVKRLLVNDLGPLNKVMFLRNFGVVVCGETVEEAYFYLINVMAACDIQSKALLAGLDNIHIPSAETQKSLFELNQNTGSDKNWKVGELEFEAAMRNLDNLGYRTGYMYRQPLIYAIEKNLSKDVEIPPAVTSHQYDTDYIKKLKEEKSKESRVDWLNSPNTYVKTELEETGTAHPKKITKWQENKSPSQTSTPIKIESKHQFVAQGLDPKELKTHQKQIKQDRIEDKKTPGYQSKILENIINIPTETMMLNGSGNNHSMHVNANSTAVENGGDHTTTLNNESVLTENGSTSILSKSKESVNGNLAEQYLSSLGNQSGGGVLFGAASKGIIKRDKQNNVGLFKTFYSSSNPFQQMDQSELDKYKNDILNK